MSGLEEEFQKAIQMGLTLCRDVRERFELLEASLERLKDEGVESCLEEVHHIPTLYSVDITSGINLIESTVRLCYIYHNIDSHWDEFSPLEKLALNQEAHVLTNMVKKLQRAREAWSAAQKVHPKSDSMDSENWLSTLFGGNPDAG